MVSVKTRTRALKVKRNGAVRAELGEHIGKLASGVTGIASLREEPSKIIQAVAQGVEAVPRPPKVSLSQSRTEGGEKEQEMGKRFTPEKIVGVLRSVELAQGQGQTIKEAVVEHGISEQTFYRWKRQFGAMDTDDVKRLKELEKENARLKNSSLT